MRKTPLLIAAALLLPMPAFAQATPAPAAAQAAPDPARLAEATTVVGKLLPQGLYKRMLGTSLSSMIDSMMGSVGDMPIGDLVRMTGISAEDAKSLNKATMRQVMEIYDPHWEERMKLGTHAIMDAMGDVMAKFEPQMREALSRAYAREFSLAELQDMDRFFSTPSGARYASKSMEMFMDPEMMQSMTKMMPELMKEMPALITKAQDATKDLPPARTNKDLTPEERKKIADLLGVDDKTLEKDPAK